MLWLDIETYSPTDLKKAGVYRYAEDPEFLILMAAWSTDGKTVHLAEGEDEIRDIPGLFDDVKVAHNAQFERVCLSRLAGLPVGEYLPPEDFIDTQTLAAELGMPQKLASLAKYLEGEQKDEAGTRLINLFSKPRPGGGRNTKDDRPEDWEAFGAYCVQDVYTLIDVHSRLGDFATKDERELYYVDQKINDRGIAIDVELAREAVRAGEENTYLNTTEFQLLTGVTNPNSLLQVGDFLEEEGYPLENLRAATVAEALARDDVPPAARRALELRQSLALTAAKKFDSALSMVGSDGRLRGTLRFHGAHTGRWAGRGVQPQNLPRAQVEDPEPHIAALKAGGRVDDETLKALVRPMFTGPFTVVDYSAIEARVLAWLAGEGWALEAFAAGRDIYVETAARMGEGYERKDGKVATLALGYQGALGSLRVMGATGSDAELLGIVRAWRETNANIVRFWRHLETAFVQGGQVGEHITVKGKKDLRYIYLPSGRPIVYRGLRRKRTPNKEELSYWDGTKRVSTYGGKLTENITQAVARDILGAALIELERRGYRVVSHVHDEVLVEGEYPVEEISEVMTSAASWTKGLPLGAAGFTTYRYRKD